MEIKPSKYFVDVILPLALQKTYTYIINQKEAIIIKPGFRVAVQFGKQKIYTAIVKKVHSISPESYKPKPVTMIMDEYPLVTNMQLKFWEWISNYYMCSEGEVLRSSLPNALLIESKSIYWVSRQADSKEGIQSFLEKRDPNYPMDPFKDSPEWFPWWREIATKSKL